MRKLLLFGLFLFMILLCSLILVSPKYRSGLIENKYCSIVKDSETLNIYLGCRGIPLDTAYGHILQDNELKIKYRWEGAFWLPINEEMGEIQDNFKYLSGEEIIEKGIANIKVLELNTFSYAPLLSYLEMQGLEKKGVIGVSVAESSNVNEWDNIGIKLRNGLNEYYMEYYVLDENKVVFKKAFQETVIY